MGRHVFYTKITPLPSNVPRLLALDLLHSHDEFIRLNPLVTNVKSIDAPRTAEGDEYFSNWYEISETLKVTGVRVKTDFKGCFHNQSWGMQSHVFAPMNIEFRNKYRIGGNQPGEPREDRELGVNTPLDGLYLREDISFTCNTFIANTVKKGMQEASQVMIDRMKRKAELLDEGRLHAMFENGTLRTSRPTQPAPSPAFSGDQAAPSPTGSGPGSPQPPFDSPYTHQEETFKPGFQNYGSLVGRHTSQSARSSYLPYQPGAANYSTTQQRPASDVQTSFISELEGNSYHPRQSDGMYPQPPKPGSGGPQAFRSELPGDSLHPSSRLPPTAVHPALQQRSSQQLSPGLSQFNGSGSGQGSPRLPSTSASDSARSSAYQITNPEQAAAGAVRNSSTSSSTYPPPLDQARSSSHNSMQEWQRSVQSDGPIDENYYRNSRSSHGGGQHNGNFSNGGGGGSNHNSYTSLEPDHQRLSNLSLQQQNGAASGDDRSFLPSRRGIEKCPVCHAFEGDEPAINHHITRVHGMR